MGPVEAAQTPENATMTGPPRDLPQAGSQPQFWPSSMLWGLPTGYNGWVAEFAHSSPKLAHGPGVLISYITSEPTESSNLTLSNTLANRGYLQIILCPSLYTFRHIITLKTSHICLSDLIYLFGHLH